MGTMDDTPVEKSKRFLWALGLLAAVAMCALALWGCAGPDRKKLLAECRAANRERARIIKEYRASNCDAHPEQDFGSLEFSETGH